MEIHRLLSRLLIEADTPIPTSNAQIHISVLDPTVTQRAMTNTGYSMMRFMDDSWCFMSQPLQLQMAYGFGASNTDDIFITPKHWLIVAKQIEAKRSLPDYYKHFPSHIPRDLCRIIMNEYVFEDFYKKIKACSDVSISN